MERELRANDYKGGWQRETLSALIDRLFDEVRVLDRCLDIASSDELDTECADIANYAMMIADNTKRLHK
jgi:hypothetical protein